MKKVRFDSIHYNTLSIDGYQKAFNFIISEREGGKSTYLWVKKLYKAFKEEGRPCLVIRRLINDITAVYIDSIRDVINKFIDEPVEFIYKTGQFKEGVCDVYIGDTLFFRVIALSNPMSRIKSLMLRNIKYIIFDEFICNTKLGEKYLPNEAFKFKELYNTFQRETENLKVYFLGNPYSLYNPYFVDLGVNLKTLKRGSIASGVNWAIEIYELKQELKDLILKKNPLYQFSDEYTKYAFGGENINDANIIVKDIKPEGYALRFAFRVEGKSVGIYENLSYLYGDERFWCGYIDNISARKKTYCFDFESLVDRTILATREDKLNFRCFKLAFNNRLISYQDIACYYLIEQIYTNL